MLQNDGNSDKHFPPLVYKLLKFVISIDFYLTKQNSFQGRQGAKSASAVSKPITPKRPVSGVARTNKTQNVKSKADFVATPSQVAAATLQSTIAR